jgi:hypothetical protein
MKNALSAQMASLEKNHAKAHVLWSEPLERDKTMWHTLRERSRKIERRRGERYSTEFNKQAVERMSACANIVKLAWEIGITRRLLYAALPITR